MEYIFIIFSINLLASYGTFLFETLFRSAPLGPPVETMEVAIARTWNCLCRPHMAFLEISPARWFQFHKENANLTPYTIAELMKWPLNLSEHCKFIAGCCTNTVISKRLPIIKVFDLGYTRFSLKWYLDSQLEILFVFFHSCLAVIL